MNFLWMSIIISFNIFAQDITSLCEKEAADFGNGKGKNLISQNCFTHFKSLPTLFASKKTYDGSILISGQKNILLIDKMVNKKLLNLVNAGSSTLLEDIIAVAIDKTHNEIAVLQESGDISFFSLTITGNVAPFRILRSKNILGSIDLVIDEKSHLVIVSNPKTQEILVYSRLANVDAMPENRKLNLIHSIDHLPGKISSLEIDITHRELFVLDEKNNQILVFNLDKITKTQNVTRIITIKTPNSKKITYDPINDLIKILDKDKKETSIPRLPKSI